MARANRLFRYMPHVLDEDTMMLVTALLQFFFDQLARRCAGVLREMLRADSQTLGRLQVELVANRLRATEQLTFIFSSTPRRINNVFGFEASQNLGVRTAI